MSNELLETISLMPDAKEELLNILYGVHDISYDNRDTSTLSEVQELINKIENI